MCGRCRQVFDAFQSLTRIEDSAFRIEQSDEQAPQAGAAGIEAPETVEASDPIFMRGEPAPFPELAALETPASEAELEPVASVSRNSRAEGHKEPAVSMPEQGASLLPETNPPGFVLEPENLLLAAPPRDYQPQATRSGAWSGAAFLLGLVMLTQLVYLFRSQIAQQFPVSRPALAAVCEWAGCTVPRSRDESAIRIEASDLVEAPGRTGRILFTATISNRGNAGQDYPTLELRLSDSSNQTVVSRVMVPAEYLGRAIGKDEFIPPGGEAFVNMQIELQGKAPASGYGVRAFYP